MLLEGKTAVISGAASPRGIGFATARLFVEHGAKVAILDLDEQGAKDAVSSLGPDHVGIGCDVADLDACRRAADAAVTALGHVDILLNNAGITQPVKIMEIDEASWRRIVDVNLTGVLYLSQAFIPHMRSRSQGSIACMSSVSAQRGGGIFGGPHYSAAKAGVLGLAKAMARELGPDGIRVNCVMPGWIRTAKLDSFLTEQEHPDEALARYISLHAVGRMGEPEDIARVCTFLLSEDSSFMTGSIVLADGGMSSRLF
jgi:NAD(P)-dependent dehydrogenase (short-subunit alcohol dehydrogenase family)